MYQLTLEQKIQNYQERKRLLVKKKENLEKQITGIEAKLTKLESVKLTSSDSLQKSNIF